MFHVVAVEYSHLIANNSLTVLFGKLSHRTVNASWKRTMENSVSSKKWQLLMAHLLIEAVAAGKETLGFMLMLANIANILSFYVCKPHEWKGTFVAICGCRQPKILDDNLERKRVQFNSPWEKGRLILAARLCRLLLSIDASHICNMSKCQVHRTVTNHILVASK